LKQFIELLFYGTYVCADIDLMPANCEDGAVRLVNGSNSLEGRLEVCFNRAWGTVCNNRFDGDDAQVVCNQLAVPYTGMKSMLFVGCFVVIYA